MRTITQITCATSGRESVVYALCNDGSLWAIATPECKWLRVENVPQDTKEQSNG